MPYVWCDFFGLEVEDDESIAEIILWHALINDVVLDLLTMKNLKGDQYTILFFPDESGVVRP